MISGQSLFLFDQREGTGPGTATFYKKHSVRLLHNFHEASLPAGFKDQRLHRDLEECVSPSAQTLDGQPVIDFCLRRADMMLAMLLRALPSARVR